jgi:hypothetical protein
VIDALPSENWNLFTLLRAHHGGDHDGRACSSSNYILAKLRAPLAGLRLCLKRLRLWLWQNNGFFGEAEAIL